MHSNHHHITKYHSNHNIKIIIHHYTNSSKHPFLYLQIYHYILSNIMSYLFNLTTSTNLSDFPKNIVYLDPIVFWLDFARDIHPRSRRKGRWVYSIYILPVSNLFYPLDPITFWLESARVTHPGSGRKVRKVREAKSLRHVRWSKTCVAQSNKQTVILNR